jgi:hypothetical protein
MGCDKCKQKKGTQKSQQNNKGNEPLSDKKTIPLIPGVGADGAFNGGILLKLVTFIILTAGLPLILIVVLLQVFSAFFMPSWDKKKKSSGLVGIIKKILRKYATYRRKKELKKRDKQFQDNMGYENLDIYAVEEEEAKNTQ